MAQTRSTTAKKRAAKKAPPKKKAPARANGRAAAKPAPKRMSAAAKKEAAARAAERERRRSQHAAILLLALAVLLACVALVEGVHLWRGMHRLLHGLFGGWALLWPLLLGYIAITTAFARKNAHMGSKVGLMVLVILLACTGAYAAFAPGQGKLDDYLGQLLALYQLGANGGGAGLFGGLLGVLAVAELGRLGTGIVVALGLFVTLMLLTNMTLPRLWHGIQRPAKAVTQAVAAVQERCAERPKRQRSRAIDVPLDDKPELPKSDNPKLIRLEKAFGLEPEPPADEQETPVVEAELPVEPIELAVHRRGAPAAPPQQQPPALQVQQAPPKEQAPAAEDSGAALASQRYLARVQREKEAQKGAQPAPAPKEAPLPSPEEGYHLPPVNMLEPDDNGDVSATMEELQGNGQQLVNVLKSFGVAARIVDISRGPSVTRYELQPAPGVKISKITSLSDDIAMNLAAEGVRIEAPIPGKAAVGVEVANRTRSTVRMRRLVESNAFLHAKSRLTVCLGRDIAGESVVADLAKMPHLLIAGTTGSGKSVCLNSFIISLLYKSTPKDVRFLMIDPKVVELSVYNGIPQLLVPVVTDPRKAAGALGWAVTEMLRRYKVFAAYNVRDIRGYNAFAAQHGYMAEDGVPLERMFRIVIFIEELADLMMAASNEVEDSICRLAQMARAAGMHMVIATQSPRVDVVTGLIKANIPSRIALKVGSQVDSRVILDGAGAEKLLGNGDMLFAPTGLNKPLRVQGGFVSDSEIESVVSFIKKAQEPGYDPAIAEEIERQAVTDKKENEPAEEGGDTDPMLEDAVKCVVEAGQASTSLLQRRLRLGYARAGRLVDQMEQMGIVGPSEGSKPRKVLMSYQQWLERRMNAQAPPDPHEKTQDDPPPFDV